MRWLSVWLLIKCRELAVFSTFEVDASTRLSRVTGIDST